MNKCKRMLCLQSFYYIRIRTSGTSVLKEALAIALPSRTNRLLESMHQDPQEVLQVSRSARVNCAVHDDQAEDDLKKE